MKISANLGMLYADMALPDAVRAAGRDGFDAVECHYPYDVDREELRAALTQSSLGMLGLNVDKGDAIGREMGLAAVPGRAADARATIDQALDYGVAIGARNVHVLAGKSDRGPAASAVFRDNLAYACDQAAHQGMTILIEPINQRDVPGYHLSTVEHAAQVIADVAADNLRMMFDCYHVQVMQGDLIKRLQTHLPIIGHIQFAGVPDRGEPNAGEVNYTGIFKALRDMGYAAPIGAEYHPKDGKAAGDLSWLQQLQSI